MDIGHFLVLFSLAATGVGMLAYLPGVRKGQGRPLLHVARPAVHAAAVGLTLTIGYLWYLILTHQFQFSYVFRYSSLDMPLKYIISSMWGGQEGTFLLWAFFGGLLSVFLRFKSKQYEAPVQFFYMGINFFLLLMLVKASPFAMFDTIPPDGNGLNPLLQDPWMTIHPPIMFFGFASLGIPAAFAMAALVKEDWDNWVPRAIPWTIFGALMLGTGLTLGGYWSYSILGWGGYWGWDPVENSSLVPWLFSVTLIHTQVIQMRRGLFRKANLLLSLLPFIFLTYSTFLTRSGVLADFSVHSFTDLGINGFLAAFMIVFLGGGLMLYVWKYRRIPREADGTPLSSREYFMFLGALSFALFGLFVCLGTSAPLISRIWGTPGNVQPEFYNRIGLPFIILVGVLMSIAPHLVWQRGGMKGLLRKLAPSFLISLAFIPLYIFGGVRWWTYIIMMWAGTFVLFSNAQIAGTIIRRKWSAAGGYVTHVGVGLMVLGILTSTVYDRSKLVELPKGKDVTVSSLGYTFRYMGSRPVEEGRKDAYDIMVSRGSNSYVLSPTMYYSEFNGGMMKKPAIQSRLTHDVYIAPGGEMKEGHEERIQDFLILSKKVPQQAQGAVFTFDRFETTEVPATADHGAELATSAVINVQRNGETIEIRPAMRTANDGHVHAEAMTIPGSAISVKMEGMDASNGRVRLGIGSPGLVLGVHGSGQVSGMNVHLTGFDVDMGAGRGTKVGVYAMAEVTAGGQVYTLKPGIINRANMDPEYVEAAIGNTGLNLILTDIDTNTREASFHIARAPQEFIWVEASTKPFIMLLWLGTGLVMIGLLIATMFRGKLAGKMAKKLGDHLGVVGKKQAA